MHILIHTHIDIDSNRLIYSFVVAFNEYIIM